MRKHLQLCVSISIYAIISITMCNLDIYYRQWWNNKVTESTRGMLQFSRCARAMHLHKLEHELQFPWHIIDHAEKGLTYSLGFENSPIYCKCHLEIYFCEYMSTQKKKGKLSSPSELIVLSCIAVPMHNFFTFWSVFINTFLLDNNYA